MYTKKDIGCYQDGSIRSDLDMLQFFIDHGFESPTLPDEQSEDYYEALEEELQLGIEWMNDNMCNQEVEFIFDAGDLLLVEIDSDEE